MKLIHKKYKYDFNHPAGTCRIFVTLLLRTIKIASICEIFPVVPALPDFLYLPLRPKEKRSLSIPHSPNDLARPHRWGNGRTGLARSRYGDQLLHGFADGHQFCPPSDRCQNDVRPAESVHHCGLLLRPYGFGPVKTRPFVQSLRRDWEFRKNDNFIFFMDRLRRPDQRFYIRSQCRRGAVGRFVV